MRLSFCKVLLHHLFKVGVFLTLFSSAYCLADSYGEVDKSVKGVSIIELIANPDKYDHEKIRVIGLVQIKIEGDSLWLSSESKKFHVSRNAISLLIDKNMRSKLNVTRAELQNFNGKYVLIEGVFVGGEQGHMSLNSGEIRDISRISLWDIGDHKVEVIVGDE